jgi:hypothetical protein
VRVVQRNQPIALHSAQRARPAILDADPLIQLTDPQTNLQVWKTRALAAIGRGPSGPQGILSRQDVTFFAKKVTKKTFAPGGVATGLPLIGTFGAD